MSETMRDRMARVVFDSWRPPHPQAEWANMPPSIQRSCYATVDAILDVLAEPTEAALRAGVAAAPFTGMSRAEMQMVEWRAMIAAIREGK